MLHWDRDRAEQPPRPGVEQPRSLSRSARHDRRPVRSRPGAEHAAGRLRTPLLPHGRDVLPVGCAASRPPSAGPARRSRSTRSTPSCCWRAAACARRARRSPPANRPAPVAPGSVRAAGRSRSPRGAGSTPAATSRTRFGSIRVSAWRDCGSAGCCGGSASRSRPASSSNRRSRRCATTDHVYLAHLFLGADPAGRRPARRGDRRVSAAPSRSIRARSQPPWRSRARSGSRATRRLGAARCGRGSRARAGAAGATRTGTTRS